MEKITYALICQEVLGNEGDLIIRNPKYLLTPLNIPGNFSFTLAIGVANLAEDGEYNLVVELFPPTRKKIIKIIDIKFNTPAKAFEHDYQIFEGNLNFGFPNFEFYEDGVYKLDIKLINDENSVTSNLEFMVKAKVKIDS